MKGAKRMGPKRQRLLKALQKASSVKEAGEIAGFGTHQSTYRAMKSIRETAPEVLERLGFGRDVVFKKIGSLMDAKVVRRYADKGIVMTTHYDDAIDVQLKASDLLARMHGAYPRGADAEDGSERAVPEGFALRLEFSDEGAARSITATVASRRGSHRQHDVGEEVHPDQG